MISHTNASVGVVPCTICEQATYKSSSDFRNLNVFKLHSPTVGNQQTSPPCQAQVKLHIQFNCCVFLMFKAVLCVDLKYAVNKLGMKGSS